MSNYSGRAALWVMGALDELQSLGIVDIGGDSPLESRDQRYDYRLLKHQGYVPEMDEIDAVLNACVAEQNLPGFRRLFEGIVKHGWKKVKELRAEAKEDEADGGPEDFYRPKGSAIWRNL